LKKSIASLFVGIAVACGGQSVLHEGDGEGGGQGGTASHGGVAGTETSGFGGSVATGGFGGSVATGGASGTVTTGGSAGVAEQCRLPIDSGPCDAAARRYGFEPLTGLCVPFIYGGCLGNANNFESAEDCYRGCTEPLSGPAFCTQSGECRAVSTQCCGCGVASFYNMVGANVCSAGIVAERRCATIDCKTCGVNPTTAWFGATCRDNHCVAFDAREKDVTECTQATDCRLRYGLGCCEACNGDLSTLVATSNESSEWLCPEGHPPCSPCFGQRVYPDGMYAVCENGRCAVVDGI